MAVNSVVTLENNFSEQQLSTEVLNNTFISHEKHFSTTVVNNNHEQQMIIYSYLCIDWPFFAKTLQNLDIIYIWLEYI